MKSIKTLGLVAFVALALAAVPGVASASVLSVVGGGVHEPEFHSYYPATIKGEQGEGVVGGQALISIRLKTVAANLNCKTATFSSSSWTPEGLTGDVSELMMAPTFGGCKLGGQAVTVTPTASCNYNFVLTGGPPYVGTLFVCKLVIFSSQTGCTVTVANQTRPGVEFVNSTYYESPVVEAKVNLSGVEYQVAGGAKCPNSPEDGSYNTGKYEGFIRLGV